MLEVIWAVQDIFLFLIFSFLNFLVYAFERQRTEASPLLVLLPKFLQQPGVGQAELQPDDSVWVFRLSDRDPAAQPSPAASQVPHYQEAGIRHRAGTATRHTDVGCRLLKWPPDADSMTHF